jgi:uncharacterized protein (UPF0335 family)
MYSLFHPSPGILGDTKHTWNDDTIARDQLKALVDEIGRSLETEVATSSPTDAEEARVARAIDAVLRKKPG